ncbi:hypothetical protein FRB90_002179 [Tulasnella sp. 427]|nr:hypothetical protein FRB90_002179 [Tulasnella sp. 427]
MPSQATSTDAPAEPQAPTTTNPGTTTSTGTTSLPAAPHELDATITRLLTSHKTVRGVMVCSRSGPIIRQNGGAFEGELGKKYAVGVKKVVDGCVKGLIEDVGGEGSDELKFLRIRTKKHELMITPGEQYIFVVLQDPVTQ